MIQVIAGKKGSGKTKRIIDMANVASRDSKHDIVFIDDDARYMYDLRHEVRFINAGEYELASDQMFMGFLCGIVSQNFDLGLVFVDAFKKLFKADLSTSEWLFERLETISKNTMWTSFFPSALMWKNCPRSSRSTCSSKQVHPMKSRGSHAAAFYCPKMPDRQLIRNCKLGTRNTALCR